MWRWCPTVAVFVTLIPGLAAQDHPKVSFLLPSGIASETVHIEYFLTGSFGGYGGFVHPESKKASFDIDPFVEGRPAENIRIIAYLPGCEVATLDLTFSGTSVERWLDCIPLGSVSFHGEVLPTSAAREQDAEIEISYLAMWSHKFYGIADGPVTTIPLGTVRPNRDGKFDITLPDLYQQAILQDGAIEFILRNVKTRNIVAFLRPANSPNWLRVQPSYPIVQLVTEAQEEQQRTRP
jgi:hypothetical protein